MSVETNTCQQMTILNKNKAVKEIIHSVKDYLKDIWGNKDLTLTVDAQTVHSSDDRPGDCKEVANLLRKMEKAERISFTMRSVNHSGLYWRLTSGFLSKLSQDPSLTASVEYRSTDYTDQDSCIEIYRFDSSGGSYLEELYTGSMKPVADISSWFSYTPDIHIETEATENQALHQAFLTAFQQLALLTGHDEEDLADLLDDDFVNGEMVWNGTLTFETQSIPRIKEALQTILTAARESGSQAEISIGAVPDGENDYDFAALSMTGAKDQLRVECCRF